MLCTPTCPCAKKRSVPATANVRIPIHEIAVVAAAANNNTFRHLILRSRNLFHGKYPSIAPWPCIDSSVVLYSQIKLVRPEHPGDWIWIDSGNERRRRDEDWGRRRRRRADDHRYLLRTRFRIGNSRSDAEIGKRIVSPVPRSPGSQSVSQAATFLSDWVIEGDSVFSIRHHRSRLCTCTTYCDLLFVFNIIMENLHAGVLYVGTHLCCAKYATECIIIIIIAAAIEWNYIRRWQKYQYLLSLPECR